MDPNYQCSICLDVLRNPHLTECCGQHYCSACLVKWDGQHLGRKTCPQCRTENFKHIRNKSLMREIQSQGSPVYTRGYPSEFATLDPTQKYSCVQCKAEPLIEPCLTECCGQHFCRSCLTGWLQAQRPRKVCPYCRQENFVYILNKSLRREIAETYIRCTHSQDGCLWRGHRDCLRKHLSRTSPDSCDYAESTCPFTFCHKTIKHADYERHLKLCKFRRERCPHCGLEVSHNAMYLHLNECPELLVPCPNKCGNTEIKRKDLNTHFNETCPLENVECQFSYAGCTERLARKDMEWHVLGNMEKHMVLLHKHNQKLQEINRELGEKNKHLQKWNRELTMRLLCMQSS